MIGPKPPQGSHQYMDVDRFVEEVKKLNPSVRSDLLRKAFEFADNAHRDQVRASGEKYVTHSINVALILAAQHMDSTTLAAGLLHDVV
jgi:GTP pyrophosphokinase